MEGEIQQLGIDKDYIQLDCSKPEKDSQGKYKTPSAEAVGAERIDEYMDEWLDSAHKNHISVLGEFGTGKTWFAKHYAWVGVRAYLQAKDKHVKRPRLPLLITLRDYANAVNLKVGTVIAGFFFNEHDISLNSEVFDRLNQMGKLLILFDGFDEMTQQIDKQKIIDNFWALAGDEVITANSKVILTCRIEHFPTTDDNKKVFEGGEIASTQAKVAAAPKFEILQELFGDAIEDNQLDHWHYDMMCQTILIRDHDGNYRPAHKSLLEFFVAFKFAAELG